MKFKLKIKTNLIMNQKIKSLMKKKINNLKN